MPNDPIARLPFTASADLIIGTARDLAAAGHYGRVIVGTDTRIRHITADRFQVGTEGSRADHYQQMTEAELRAYLARVEATA